MYTIFTLQPSFKPLLLLWLGGGGGVKSVCRFVEVTVNSKEDFWSHYVQEFDLWIKICTAQYSAIADVSHWKKIIFLWIISAREKAWVHWSTVMIEPIKCLI